MRGKEKCKALKKLRKQIAEENDIAYAVSECTFQGECKGTCPKCEAELRYLERELEVRRTMGKTVALVGLGVGLSTMTTGCLAVDIAENVVDRVSAFGASILDGTVADPELEGDVRVVDPDDDKNSTEDGIEGEVQNPGYSSEEDTSDWEGVIELEGDVAVPETDTEEDGES